mmetsp:Transcript_12643/g.30045  ORF Transcript_12643/g.30045 Transcript_12643/m.30045 type:complete len:278 (+) Transcript_12643:1705-2538(+)
MPDLLDVLQISPRLNFRQTLLDGLFVQHGAHPAVGLLEAGCALAAGMTGAAVIPAPADGQHFGDALMMAQALAASLNFQDVHDGNWGLVGDAATIGVEGHQRHFLSSRDRCCCLTQRVTTLLQAQRHLALGISGHLLLSPRSPKLCLLFATRRLRFGRDLGIPILLEMLQSQTPRQVLNGVRELGNIICKGLCIQGIVLFVCVGPSRSAFVSGGVQVKSVLQPQRVLQPRGSCKPRVFACILSLVIGFPLLPNSQCAPSSLQNGLLGWPWPKARCGA